MNSPEQSLLGKPVPYADRYDPSLLFPIARAPKREEIGIAGAPPFFGADLWTAYEVSWLNPRGKPQLAIAHVTIPCETPNIVESKSFKLYLGSFNSTVFASHDAVRDRLRADLSEAVWRGAPAPSTVGVKLLLPDAFDQEDVQDQRRHEAAQPPILLSRRERDADRRSEGGTHRSALEFALLELHAIRAEVACCVGHQAIPGPWARRRRDPGNSTADGPKGFVRRT